MMRKYFENVTGVVTGSDNHTSQILVVSLQHSGFKGESVCGLGTWIKKSHFPYIFPLQKDSQHDMAIICTRFELDSEPSLF